MYLKVDTVKGRKYLNKLMMTMINHKHEEAAKGRVHRRVINTFLDVHLP